MNFSFKNFHIKTFRFVLYVLLVIAVIALVCVLIINSLFVKRNPISADATPSPTVMQITNKVKIQLAGNVVLSNGLLETCFNNGDYDFSDCFSRVEKYIDGDIALFNMEGLIDGYGNQKNYKGAPIYNYPPQLASQLRSIGFNTALTANDQALNLSAQGVRNNIKNLSASSLLPLGTDGQELKPIVKNYNGIVVALLAYTDNLAVPLDETTAKMINKIDLDDIEQSAEKIKNDIKLVRSQGAEIVLVSLHWGKELDLKPLQSQRELAQSILEGGADIIYGTLPQPFQSLTYKSFTADSGDTKNVIVAYSLGNFLFEPTVTSGLAGCESGILNIYIERDSHNNAYISSAECVPLYVYKKESGGTQNVYVLPSREYSQCEQMPDIFASQEDWNDCKAAFSEVENVLKNVNGMEIGLS